VDTRPPFFMNTREGGYLKIQIPTWTFSKIHNST